MTQVQQDRTLTRAQIEALANFHNAIDGCIYYATDGGIYIGKADGSVSDCEQEVKEKVAELESDVDNVSGVADSAFNIAKQLQEEGRTIVEGDVTNNPDEEDLTEVGGVLKLKDRVFAPADNSGLGYKILRKDLTFAEQVTDENTIYEIRYNFDLDGQEVEILKGCILKFNGGKLSNGKLIGTNTKINAGIELIFDLSIIIEGSWLIRETYPEWFGGVSGTNISSVVASANAIAIEKALSITNSKLVLNSLYGINKPIGIKNEAQVIEGRHAFYTQRFGIYCTNDFSSIDIDGKIINSLFYPEAQLGVPLILSNAWFSGSYKASTLITQFDDYKVGIRMYGCYVFRFYDAGLILRASDSNTIKDSIFQFCGIGLSGEGKEIDYSNPLSNPTTVVGRPNHTVIENCQFHRNNVGIVFSSCSDLSLSNNMFGYNSLASIFLYECMIARLVGNYIEGDCNYKFKIYEGRVVDPPSNAEISMGQEVDVSLIDMDVTYRSYVRIVNSNLVIDSFFCSNYYVRCYETGDGTNYNDPTISGFDALFYITGVESKLHIGTIKNVKSMRVEEDAVGNIYDVISYNSDYINGAIKVSSDFMIKYLNIEVPYSSNTVRGLKEDSISIEETKEFVKETIQGNVQQCISQSDYSWDFFQYFNFAHQHQGIDYYKVQLNNQRRNVLRIKYSALNKELTYAIAIHYYKSVKQGFEMTAYYSDDSSETITIDSGSSFSAYNKILHYFTPNQFVRKNKECTYIVFTNITPVYNDYPCELSTFRLYIAGNPNPLYMNNNLIGSYRPSPHNDEMVIFYDTTLKKPIYWTGSKWIDATGLDA